MAALFAKHRSLARSVGDLAVQAEDGLNNDWLNVFLALCSLMCGV